MEKKVIVSGSRPTGNIHLGNYFGAISNWVNLQEEYDCNFFIADWHALTTGYADTESLRNNTLGLLADYIASGVDPKKAVIFQQSQVKEHAELFLLLFSDHYLHCLFLLFRTTPENLREHSLHLGQFARKLLDALLLLCPSTIGTTMRCI